MPNKTVFIISSTINTNIGYYDPQTRFYETIETIKSIKSYADDSMIILIDNSLVRLSNDLEELIQKMVDYYLYIGDRKLCIEINKSGVRSAGEAYIILVAFDLIKNFIKCDIDRIFKMSGRYKLIDKFNLSEYSDVIYKYKYCFRKNDSDNDTCYHTRLWSFCYSLFDEVEDNIKTVFSMIYKNQINIEDALYLIIDKNKVIMKDKVYCEGRPALWDNIHITE